MSYKPNDLIIADYLGGELSKEETAKLEAYLAKHPEEKKEIEDLQSLQGMMSGLGDKEVTPPSFVFEEAPSIVIAEHRSIDRFLKSSLAIAASIALLLLVGYFTKFSISQSEDGLQVSFGNTVPANDAGVSKEEMKEWMQETLATNNAEIINKINAVESSFDERQDIQLVTNKPSKGAVDQKIVDQYIAELRLANRDIILGLLEDSERSQQEYLTGVMTEFANFMQLEREKDLDRIQLQFSSILNQPEDSNLDNYLRSE